MRTKMPTYLAVLGFLFASVGRSRSRLLNGVLMRVQATLPFVIAACLYGHPARADFRMQGAASEGAAAPLAASPVPDGPGPGRKVQAAIRPRVAVAVGFGRQIPLSFAARQIVPASLPVRFTPEVDQDTLVDWSGGRPWNQVIAATVQPLHLRAVITARGVLIGP